MVKRWFGFSERVLAGAVSLTVLCATVVAGAAEGTPAPMPSTGTAQVLSYPFVDIVAKAGGSAVHVGDKIEVRLAGGISNDLGRDLSLSIPETQTDAVYDQGWSVGPGMVISPVKVGQLSLPTLEVKNGLGQVVAKTNPFSLGVESSISSKDPKPQEPAELRPPVGVPFPLYLRILLGILIAALVGMIGYFGWRWISYLRRKPVIVEPPQAEDVRAMAALESLVARGHLGRGEHKLHYFKLSEILKNYLGERFDIDAPESTTYELTSKLSEKLPGAASVDLIHGFFEGIDTVKFTDHVPLDDENQKRFEEAKQIIVTTKKAPTPILAALEVRP